MTSTAIDDEQSSQRAVDTRASSELENEKAGFNNGQSSSEEKSGNVWQPEDA